jgi:oligopeptide transport system substrate-binding protein
VIRIHQPTYPDVFDPQKSSYVNEIAVLLLNYEGLTKQNPQGEAIPAAAEAWEFNEGGDVITFTLRDNLTYSDGSPLTSERFAYALERNCDPATAGEYQSILFEVIGCADFASTLVTDTAAYEAAREALGVETPDDRTLVVRFTNPAPYATYLMGLWVTYPAKEELIEEGGESWWQNAQYHVGNGPFRITDIQEDSLITFDPNENYWEGPPAAGGIEYVYQGDSAVALAAYQQGDLDIVSLDPSQLPQIESDPQLSEQLVRYPTAFTTQLQFKLNDEPFNDPKVREAFAYAFDRETWCTVVRNNDCVPTLTWIPEGLPGSVETDKFAFNPDAARQALAESSYGGAEGLPEITFTYSNDDPATQPRVEWIAGQYRDILGINLTLQPVEGTALTGLKKDNSTYPQMSTGGWIQDYPDPQNWLSVYWRSDATFAQRVQYKNEEFDRLTREADTLVGDEARRLELYEQAHQILIDEQPGVNLHNAAAIYLVKPEVTGYEESPSDVEWPGLFGSNHTITKGQ